MTTLIHGSTETAVGTIPHYPLRTTHGVVYCPVKLQLDEKGRIKLPRGAQKKNILPMPVSHNGKIVFVAPGGIDIIP